MACSLDEEPPQEQDYKSSLADLLVPHMLSSWLDTIAKTANEICADSGIRFEKGGYCGRISTPTRESKECVIEAIDRHIEDAPEVAREVLAAYRARLQESLSEPG